MSIDTQKYRITEKKEFKLSDNDTDEDGGLQKADYEVILSDLKLQMSELQERLYAENKQSLLIIFQAMDAAGKDSAIKHVMSGLNPQGCQVYSFKQPTSEELDHDFLWRHYKALPERGRIGIHNRSHYENVLICKVHPSFAANESQTPLEQIDEVFWSKRYASIRNFEKHLITSKTKIIKFFLHISKEEQKERFLKRINDPAKNWKFASGDIAERALWERYMAAYEDAISETSTEESPWYVVPGDKKWFARLVICKVIVDTLTKMSPQFPELSPEEKEALLSNRTKLLEENE